MDNHFVDSIDLDTTREEAAGETNTFEPIQLFQSAFPEQPNRRADFIDLINEYGRANLGWRGTCRRIKRHISERASSVSLRIRMAVCLGLQPRQWGRLFCSIPSGIARLTGVAVALPKSYIVRFTKGDSDKAKLKLDSKIEVDTVTENGKEVHVQKTTYYKDGNVVKVVITRFNPENGSFYGEEQ